MECQEFCKILQEKAEIMNIKINNEQSKQFYEYMNILLKWNQNINLTAIIEPNEVIIKHFIDSLTIEKEIKEDACLIDIGTGAGFPGIPLKILKPDLSIVLLDSLQKRIRFLENVIETLQLKNITAIHGRAEDVGKDEKYREKFDYVTSRAVANLTTLAEYMLPLTKIGGKSIVMKGAEIEEEMVKSKKAINLMGGLVEKVDNFLLADTNNNRNIIVIHKKNDTPKLYPRKSGIPAKSPII